MNQLLRGARSGDDTVGPERTTLHKEKARKDKEAAEKDKKSDKKGSSYKLIKNDKGSIIYRLINRSYSCIMILSTFTRRLLWFGSCAAFLWLFPISYELFNE